MRIPAALLLLLGLSACAVPGNERPSNVTYEKLVQPFPRREALHCYAAGRKPFPVLSYGECVSKKGTMVSGYAEQWLAENWRWFQVRGWERLTRETRRISRELEDAGLDPNSREYTAELTRRVAAYRKAHPEVVPASGTGKKSKKTRRRLTARRPRPASVSGEALKPSLLQIRLRIFKALCSAAALLRKIVFNCNTHESCLKSHTISLTNTVDLRDFHAQLIDGR